MDQPPTPPGGQPPADAEPEVLEDVDLIEPDGSEAAAPPPVPGGPPPVHKHDQVAYEDITDADRQFLQTVFKAVQNVDWNSPPPPPPRGLTGLDKKMHGLREDVRKFERQLARLAHIWRIRETRVNEVEKIIAAEDAKRSQSDTRYAQMKDQATKAAAEHKAEAQKLSDSIAYLEKVKADLENNVSNLQAEVQKEQTEKQQMLADFKQKMEQAQAAFNQLRDQSTQHISERDEKLQKLEIERDDEVAVRDSEIVTLNQNLQEKDAEISKLNDEAAGLKGEIDAKTAAAEEAQKDLEESRAKVDELESELGELQQQLGAAKSKVEDRDRDIENLKKKVADLESAASAAAKASDDDG